MTTAPGLVRYLPRAVIEWVRDRSTDDIGSLLDACEGVILLADVAGFTRLAENFATQGPLGAELLHRRLNAHFDLLVRIILEIGGDIVSFAGDAVVALWRVDLERSLGECRQRAARCALALRETFVGGAHAGRPDAGSLPLRIVVADGVVYETIVSGDDYSLHYVLGSTLFEPLATALRVAPVGSVTTTEALAQELGGAAQWLSLGDGFVELTVAQTPTPAISPPLAVRATSSPLLERFVPFTVRQLIDVADQSAAAEFRTATIAFLQLSRFAFRGADDVERLRRFVRLLYQAVGRYGGVVTAVKSDEKGTYGTAVWGVPGASHENNCERALRAVVALRDQLLLSDEQLCAGIGTGRVLSGRRGSEERCEYAVTGDSVVIAARMMTLGIGIHCDEATAQVLRSARFDVRSAVLELKGRAQPVNVYALTNDARILPDRRSDLIGREAEMAELERALLDAVHDEAHIVVVTGEAGIGKSSVLDALAALASEAGRAVLRGQGLQIEKAVPYHAWRPVLQLLLGPEGDRRDSLERATVDEPRLRAWLPVLNDVLPVGLEPNETTRSMSAEARSTSVAALVTHLIARRDPGRPLLIVLDDVQWMDSLSWSLTVAVATLRQPVMLLLARRSEVELRSQAASYLLTWPSVRTVDLGQLRERAAALLVARLLGVESATTRLLELVRRHAGGRPFYLEEVIQSLQRSGAIAVRDGVADLTDASAGQRDTLLLSTTFRNTIEARVDALSSSASRTLKVASAVGQEFAAGVLAAVRSDSGVDAPLISDLDELMRARLVVTGSGEDAQAERFAFRHALVHQAVYELMPVEQRKNLHRRVALVIEARHASDLDEVLPLLAHHWSKAGAAQQAYQHHRRAGLRALSRFANNEAIAHFNDALSLQSYASGDDAEEWGLLYGLALAHYGLGNFVEVAAVARRALRLEGRAVPERSLGIGAATAYEALRQAFYRLFGAPLMPETMRRRGIEAWEIMLRMGHIAYFESDLPVLGLMVMRCLNLAQRLVKDPRLGMMYASMAAPLSAMHLPKLAAHYHSLGLKTPIDDDAPDARAQAELFRAIYFCGLGKWDDAFARAYAALEINERFGDLRRSEECMTVIAYAEFFRGDLAASGRAWAHVRKSAEARRDDQTRVWSIVGECILAYARGRIDEAEHALSLARGLKMDALSCIGHHGYTAAFASLAGRHEVEREAHARLSQSKGVRPTSFSGLPGESALFAAVLGARAKEFGGRSEVHRRLLRAMLAVLTDYSRSFPIAVPTLLLRRGQVEWCAGRRARAVAHWTMGREHALALGMRYDELLNLWNLAQHDRKHLAAANGLSAALELDAPDVRRVAIAPLGEV